MKSLPKKIAYLFLMSLITISPKLAHADDASDKADEARYQKIISQFTQFSSVDDLKKQGFEFSVTGAAGLKDGSVDDNDCPTKIELKVDSPFATFGDGNGTNIIITQDNLHFPAHLKDAPTNDDDSNMFYLVKDNQNRLIMVSAKDGAAYFFTFAASGSVLMQHSAKVAVGDILSPQAGGCILHKATAAQASVSDADASKAVKAQSLLDAGAAKAASGAADAQVQAK